MYKANTGGSADSKSGVRHEWNAGDKVDAEKGELDHVGSLTWVEESDTQEEYPVHTGGGYYELSNGEKIRGKENAIEAESELQ